MSVMSSSAYLMSVLFCYIFYVFFYFVHVFVYCQITRASGTRSGLNFRSFSRASKVYFRLASVEGRCLFCCLMSTAILNCDKKGIKLNARLLKTSQKNFFKTI